MMFTQHSVIIINNNYRMIKRLSPASTQMAPANQRSFKTIVSDDLVGQSLRLMLFRVENLIGISKKYELII
jgi:hypothetical protein